MFTGACHLYLPWSIGSSAYHKTIFLYDPFICAFARQLQNAPVTLVMSVCWFNILNKTTQLTGDEFLWAWLLQIFTVICQHTLFLVKMGGKIRNVLHENPCKLMINFFTTVIIFTVIMFTLFTSITKVITVAMATQICQKCFAQETFHNLW